MNGHRRISVLAAGAALVLTTASAASAFAATPERYSWGGHFDFPAIDCPGFTAWGEFDISHDLTVYIDSAGNATGDLERIEYTGRFYNPDTQVSVADRGSKRFLDTFAPDGSYASTIFTAVRIDKYVGEAGRVVLGPQDASGDQPLIRSVGHDGFT
ncbi:MAG TPA: hypothetical protein VFC71_06885, partial [Candidatus Polarisedimenticolia bacterium]|nr:hypothetical protein [Candidatus Polarisedimenticolia bacterium]